MNVDDAPWNTNPLDFPLTPHERKLCDMLWEASPKLVRKETIHRGLYGLLEESWPDNYVGCVKIFVHGARRKLKGVATIHTIWGAGLSLTHEGED